MEWIILFIISWALFLTAVDWKAFKRNIWCGLVAMAMQLSVDHQLIRHGLYVIRHNVFDLLLGSSIFFVTGPVFTMGVLLAQHHPKKRGMIIMHCLIYTVLYSLQELLILNSGALEYLNWHYIDSILVNLGAIGLLSWFVIVVLEKREET